MSRRLLTYATLVVAGLIAGSAGTYFVMMRSFTEVAVLVAAADVRSYTAVLRLLEAGDRDGAERALREFLAFELTSLRGLEDGESALPSAELALADRLAARSSAVAPSDTPGRPTPGDRDAP